ncbi:MAG: hypothetical protein ACPGEF_05000 [Endozoicomonas sp.]
MLSLFIRLFSWVATAWITKVFLSSLPYKFSNHPDTQHIFGIIGQWIGNTFNLGAGDWFSHYGAIAVGLSELSVSLLLIVPAIFLIISKISGRPSIIDVRWFHCLGGLAASIVMAGAIFFHLATPLGIVVLHEGKSDGGSLFYAASSIMILGLAMAVSNYYLIKNKVSVSI